MSPRLLNIFILAILLLATGCTADRTDEPAAPTPQVVVLFSPGGLGDMSYNDCILQGVQGFKKEHPEVDVFMSSYGSLEETDRIFSDWLKRPESNIPVLFVLASSDFEPLVEKYNEEYTLPPNKTLLLFETTKTFDKPGIHTFQISMFGASYLAGVSASAVAPGAKSMILLGSSSDKPIQTARDGFLAGNGGECETLALAEDWQGFVMPTFTYREMSSWALRYGFIFPVAGGSNAGIYRYSREFSNCPFLAGMDVDQSDLSSKITGSVVKRFDRLINEYFSNWLKGIELPKSALYGLESGYVDWQLSPRFEERLGNIVESNREKAITEEKYFYEQNH